MLKLDEIVDVCIVFVHGDCRKPLSFSSNQAREVAGSADHLGGKVRDQRCSTGVSIVMLAK